jgi:ribonuclease HI
MRKIVIHTDGGARGNPGPAAIGVAFYNEKKQCFKKYSEYLGDNITNNQAEYQAVVFALEKFKAVFGKKLAKNTEVEIKTDSELLIKQLKGEYKVLDSDIQKLFLKIWNLKIDFKKVKFSFVNREKNKQADQLVNQALDELNRSQKLL